MSEFVGHEPCPKCNSKDNLGVWDDGHKWCFGCGYFVPRDGVVRLEEIAGRLGNTKNNKKNRYNDLSLPDDFTRSIPKEPLEWLKKYGLLDKEIIANSIGWSQQHERLIFPIFNNVGDLTFYQGRAFSARTDKSKYHTQGYSEDIFHVMGVDKEPLVLVEDFISAIKVSRVRRVMPLWGSNISLQRALRLQHVTKDVRIWLDKDKATYAVNARQLMLPYFRSVECIITEHDPKEYGDAEIELFVKEIL